MMNDADEQILDFLSTKENLAFTFEIGRHIPEIKKRIHRQFWEAAYNRLNNFAADLETFRADWEIEFECKDALAFTNWRGVRIKPRNPPSQELYVMPALDQGSPGFLPCYKWSACTNIASDHPVLDWPTIKRLLETAKEKGLTGGIEPWYLAWGYKPWIPGDEQFCLQFVENPELIFGDTVDVMWRLFEEQRNTLIEANQALADAIAQGEDLTQ